MSNDEEVTFKMASDAAKLMDDNDVPAVDRQVWYDGKWYTNNKDLAEMDEDYIYVEYPEKKVHNRAL